VIPASFDYLAPSSLAEALAALARNPDDSKILAGGHSLIPLMKLRLSTPGTLIDLARVPGLRGISRANGGLTIGAMTTHADIARSPDVAAAAAALSQAARQIGDRQVRARGTIGGSLTHADPAADLPAVILALGATMVLRSASGERTVAADDFFVGLLESAVRPDEVLTEVRIPASPRSTYEKVPNPASHYAIVGVAVALGAEPRVGVTGAAAVAFRATGAESALRGGSLDAALAARAASQAYDGRELLSDIHASDEYRANLIEVSTRRALTRLAG
jgi:carbon-monoxide dehydrogenase medium subunit